MCPASMLQVRLYFRVYKVWYGFCPARGYSVKKVISIQVQTRDKKSLGSEESNPKITQSLILKGWTIFPVIASKNVYPSQARWLMPVIPALWAAEERGSPEVRNSRPAWPTWQNPISTKNTKTSWAWWHVPIIPATRGLRQKDSLILEGGGCSEPRACHCTPVWATEWGLHLKKNVFFVTL